MKSRPWITTLILTLLAVLVQGMALTAIAALRGSPTAYAYQSPDSAEYVAFARGLAQQGRYLPLDASGRPLPCANTWRTPGYPAFLALVIRWFGDNALTLLLAQQLVAAAAVPLAYVLFRRFTSGRWAVLATAAWALDPFRLYYSQWLLAETLFVFTLLIAACVWGHPGRGRWTCRRAVLVGIITGIAVLVRPIGLLLPPLAWLGVGLSVWRRYRVVDDAGVAIRAPSASEGLAPHPLEPIACAQGSEKSNTHTLLELSHARRYPSRTLSHAIFLALACAAGTSAVVGPYVVRNRIVAGHFALTPQTGPSFAYHKVVDVVLFSQDKSRYRFDARTLDEVRTEIDHRLQIKWEQHYGPLTLAQREALTFTKLNFGEAPGIDPFAASSLLWSVGLELLADHPWALVQCFLAQGTTMLVFPLGLVLFPPAGEGAAPLSTLLGSGSTAASVLAAALGVCYTALILVICGRLIAAAWRRHWPTHFFAIWPILALVALTLPFEDPRFRLPMIPFLWLLAVGRQVRHS